MIKHFISPQHFIRCGVICAATFQRWCYGRKEDMITDHCKYSIKLLPYVTFRLRRRAYGSAVHLRRRSYGIVLHLRQRESLTAMHLRHCTSVTAVSSCTLVQWIISLRRAEPSRAEPDPPVPYARSGRCLGLASACCNCTSPGIQKLTAISRAVTHRCPKLAHFHQGPFMTPQLRNGW